MTDSSTSSAGGRRALVVGVGLIGGSIGAALRRSGWHVTGRDLDSIGLQEAVALGAIDEIAPAAGPVDAELTFVATPVGAIAAEVQRALADTDGLVTDAGSVKAPLLDLMDDPRFVGGHPMAGSELEGVAGARSDLFEGRTWVLTPVPGTDDDAFAEVRAVVAGFGAEVVSLPPERHDSMVALVSHVPHLTAATLMGLADESTVEHRGLLRLAAGGFRDMTRIAAGHPGIWPDICAENRAAVVAEELDRLVTALGEVRDLVDSGDREGLLAVLDRARSARLALPVRFARADELSEIRVPLRDQTGALAGITTLATELDVSIADIEIAHSVEGDEGVLILLVEAALGERLRHGLAERGYKPVLRPLEGPEDSVTPVALSDPLPIEPFDGPIDATVRPPGSKSLTNRALVAAALADGTSRLTGGALFADDTEAMLACIEALGAGIEVDRAARVVEVRGTGGRLATGPIELHADLSGTTSRFVAAVLALGAGPFHLDGGAPLRARPMGPVLDAVRQLGATVVEDGETGHLPITVLGGATGVGPGGERAVVRLPGDISSQFVSGLLLAGACLPAGLRIELSTDAVSGPYLDMTIAVMGSFGATARADGPRAYVVEPGGYRPATYAVEPDASAASYLFAAAAVCGGRVRVEGLGRGSLQGDIRFVDALEQMGCTVDRGDHAIEVVGGPLHGIEADFEPISDTAQTIAAVAAFAEGPTRITGIGFIRRKETDRIAAVVTELRRAGVGAVEEHDGFVVQPSPVRPATIETYDDHRMAMSFTLLGLRAPGISIADPGCVAKTFPDYFDVIETLRPRSTP